MFQFTGDSVVTGQGLINGRICFVFSQVECSSCFRFCVQDDCNVCSLTMQLFTFCFFPLFLTFVLYVLDIYIFAVYLLIAAYCVNVFRKLVFQFVV